MQKEGKIQKGKMLMQSSSCVHFFGYKYEKQANKQNLFSQVSFRETKNNEEIIASLKLENQRLQFQLDNIKNLLFKIVHPKQQYPIETTIDELLEQLFEIILRKCQQISQFKKQNQLLKEQIQSLLKNSTSSIPSEIVQSRLKSCFQTLQTHNGKRPSQLDLQYSKITKKNKTFREEGNRCSQQSNKTCSMYRPRVLFQIGKEVNTVNQISSRDILRKQQADISYQIKTSQSNSFNQFKKIKSHRNRMSIQGSIYTENQDEVQRINIYSNNQKICQQSDRISQSLFQRQQNKAQLFEIQQQQSIDSRKQFQFKGLTKMPKRQRFTPQINGSLTVKRPSLNL